MTNVRLKYKDKKTKVKKEEVKKIAFNNLHIPFVRLFETPDGFKAICRNDEEIDKVLSKKARDEFDKIGITVITPPEIRAKRSIFIRKIEEDVGSHTEQEIKNELEDKNSWMSVAEVIKIKNYYHVMKVSFQETSMAERATNNGFVMFNTSFLPTQISREEFTNLQTCFICYRYENHTTQNCPEKGKLYCSECGQEGHKYTECKENYKKCLNCIRNGKTETGHRTLAMACPVKKQLIEDKKEVKKVNEEDKQNKTYAMIATKTAQAVQGEKTEINLSEVTHFKILTSIMHAHVLNLQTPGSYKKELNIMLKQNGLPEMWFPDNPNSGAVLGSKTTVAQTEGTNTVHTEQSTQRHIPMKIIEDRNTYKRKDKERTADPRKQANASEIMKTRTQEMETDRETVATTDEEGEVITVPEKLPKTSEDIGLTIYITNNLNYPTRQPKRDEITKGIEKGTHKYTYDNKQYHEDLIEYLLMQGELEISKDDFKLVDHSKYKKVRNGPSKLSPQGTRKKHAEGKSWWVATK